MGACAAAFTFVARLLAGMMLLAGSATGETGLINGCAETPATPANPVGKEEMPYCGLLYVDVVVVVGEYVLVVVVTGPTVL